MTSASVNLATSHVVQLMNMPVMNSPLFSAQNASPALLSTSYGGPAENFTHHWQVDPTAGGVMDLSYGGTLDSSFNGLMAPSYDLGGLMNNLGTSFHESYRFVHVLFRNLALILVVYSRAATLLSDSLSESQFHGPKPSILGQTLPNEPMWSSTLACYNNPMASSHYGGIIGSF